MAEQPPMYQHFVPQFILRNFAHPYSEPDKEPDNDHNMPKRRKKPRYQKGKPSPGDAMVHHVDLTSDPPRIVESPIKRVLGLIDMYRDTSQPAPKQQHIEALFGKLESRASTVLRRITKAFDAGQDTVLLARGDVNVLRKFLFLLKYRGSTFHRRFYHVDVAEYSETDSPLLRDYMREREIKRPIDVWLGNLKAIMELEMDPGGEWVSEILEKMYLEDAAWFISHVQYMYMAICTPPADSDREFVLTDHCYNVFDGPATLICDRDSEEIKTASYASLHDLAPVTPKLMLVLRHYVFPLPEEDADPHVAKHRAEFRKLAIDDQFGPEAIAKSRLADLPITKARNSYSDVVDGGVRLRTEWSGQFTVGDSFCFKFFPTSENHVDAMNGIILDNSWLSTTVVFASRASFSRALDTYLATPSTDGKCVTGQNGDARLATLKKFAVLSKDLGSNKQPCWTNINVGDIVDYKKLVKYQVGMHRWVKHWIQTPLKDQGTFMETYTRLGASCSIRTYTKLTEALGGSPGTLMIDLRQAGLMWDFRVGIDRWSQGVDEDIRKRNRQLVTAAYIRCAPRRLWLYMKTVKVYLYTKSSGRSVDDILSGMKANALSGSEDVIVKARALFNGDDERLNKLIYQTALNEGDMKFLLRTDIWTEPKPGEDYASQVALVHKIVWETPGLICQSGIPEIENFAMSVQLDLMKGDTIDVDNLDHLEHRTQDTVECMSRNACRFFFTELLAERLDEQTISDLKKVFFELTYPTLPMPTN